jgi:polysaccharide pyruvyl transferase WcaK-like protein
MELQLKKIVICGLVYERNLGDPVIVASARALIKGAVPESGDVQIETTDLFARTGTHTYWDEKRFNVIRRLPLVCLGALRRVCEKLDKPLGRRIAYARWRLDPNGRKRLVRYFKAKLEGASLVVLPGGGLIEYCSHEYQLPIGALVETAGELNVPVVFNAVGVVGGAVDEGDWRYRMMKAALNSPAVKSISVRDDIQTMNGQYLEGGRMARRTADPGVWIAELLGRKRKEDADVIGLGLIRGDAFTDYGIGFGEEELITLWADITRELDKRGLKWAFFCNGYEKDYALGLKILGRLGVADTAGRLVERPTEYPALLDTIASFRAVICHRLHACIMAYALGVPCVALSWNKKLRFFFDAIGCPERVYEAGAFDAMRIVDAALRAEEEGYDPEIRRKYMEEARNSIVQAVELIRYYPVNHQQGRA